MKLNFTKTFGQFALTASCDVSESQIKDLATLGALYLFERQPSTAVEQQVFAPMLGWTKGERGTSFKRPAGFNRNSVEFTPELAQKIKDVYENTEGKIADGNTVVYDVQSIVFNESGTASEMVRATTLVDSFLGNPTLEAPYRMILEEGATTPFTREELITAAHAKKLGIQPAKAGK